MNDWPVTPIVTGQKNREGYVPTPGTVTASTKSLPVATRPLTWVDCHVKQTKPLPKDANDPIRTYTIIAELWCGVCIRIDSVVHGRVPHLKLKIQFVFGKRYANYTNS
jgi:hypothetical protein